MNTRGPDRADRAEHRARPRRRSRTQLFTMLVVMALVTTFMAGPVLRLIDPRRELSRAGRGGAAPRAPRDRGGHPVVPAARSWSRRRIRVNLDALLALAEPLAKATPPREIIIAQARHPRPLRDGRAARPGRRGHGRGRAGAEAAALARTGHRRSRRRLHHDPARAGLRAPRLGGGGRPDPARTAAGRSSARAFRRERSAQVLEQAPCDVAVLVERKDDADDRRRSTR